jgi:hypothetical protein
VKVTGYKIREAIKQWELRKDAASRVFDDSLKIYPGETKEHPVDAVKQYLAAEYAIAKLQEAQAMYNLQVKVPFDGELITLGFAVKALGGLARAEKMWRSATGSKKERYGYSADERDPNKIYAQTQVSASDALKNATSAAKRASAMRAAIAQGNAEEHEIKTLTEDLFE